MANRTNFIISLAHITAKNKTDVGIPPLELAELMSANVPIPPGFVVTQAALEQFAYNSQLDLKVKQLQQIGSFNENTLTKLVLESEMPKDILNELTQQYSNIAGISNIWMRIRAGLYDQSGEPITFIDENEINEVKGIDALQLEIKKIWAKLLIIDQKYDSLGSFIIVQKLVPAEVSGLLYTRDYFDDNTDHVLVKCVYGEHDKRLKDSSDSYIFSKSQEKIIDRTIAPQNLMFVRSTRNDFGYEQVEISEKWQMKQKLSDKHIEDLGYLGDYLENVFGKPQEVAWVFQAGKIWINYVKPLTEENVESNAHEKEITEEVEELNDVIEENAKEFEEEKVDIQLDEPVNEETETPIEDILPTQNIEKEEEEHIEEVIENVDKEIEGDLPVIESALDQKVELPEVNEIKQDVEKDKTLTEEVNNDIDINLRVESVARDVLVAGMGNNKGVLEGKVVFNREECTDKDILILPEWDDMPKTAAAVIVEDIIGVASEIPIIYGAELATKILREGEFIKVDTNTGFIFELQTGIKEIEEPEETNIPAEEKVVETKEEKPKKEKKVKKTKKEAIVPIVVEEKKKEEKEVAKEEVKKVEKKNLEDAPKAIVENEEKIRTAIKIFAHVSSSNQLLVNNDGIIFDLPHAQDYVQKGEKIDYKGMGSLIYSFVTEYLHKNKDLAIFNVIDTNPTTYIKNSELLEVQCEAVHKIRNKENLRNLHIALPKFKTLKQLREFRKSLSSVGLRRSTTFKVYIKVAYSSNIFELKQYLEDRFDGVIVTVDALYNSLYSSERKMVKITDTLLSALDQIQKDCKSARIPMILDLKGVKLSSSVLQKLSPYILYGVSVLPKYTDMTKKFIANIEKERIFK